MKKLIPLILFIALAMNAQAIVTITLTSPPCHSDGVLTANFTGLTPPLTVTWGTYGWSGTTITHTGVSGLTDVLTSYAGGNIYLTVTDAGGATDWGSFSSPLPFTYTVTATPAYCPASGTATASVTGGTGPYTYQWYTVPGMVSVSTANPATLTSGTYGVRITDAAGCVFGSEYSFDSVSIYSIPPFTFSASGTPANCTNGTATTGPITGSTGPFSYLWSNGATSSSVTGLVTGWYSVTVTDGSGCSGDDWVYINQVVSIGAPITPTPATCTATDGAAIVFPTGGVPPYTYLWSNSVTLQSQSGMPAGAYNVTVTDANGCIGKGYTTIGTSTPITVTYSTTASSCTSATGTATLVPTGGTGPYTYQWNTLPVQTTATATGLAPGTYGFKVTDATGCVRTGSVPVPPVNVITASVAITPALCTLATGAATVTPSGGVGAYSYSWIGGGSTSGITGKPSGGYTVTITDAMGCKLVKSLYIPESSPVTLGVSSTPASCIFTSDGTATAVPSGGTGPYTYSWSGTGGTTSSVSGLPTGHYYVDVVDASGCTAWNHILVGYNTSATSCYCTISGTVYHDANNNCTQDVGEAGIPNIQIQCSGMGYTYTDASGNYSFKVPSGSYTISETIKYQYPLSSCQTNYIPVSVTAASGCVHTVNFANAVNPLHDIHISTWNYNFAVPGNPYMQNMVITNAGTVTESVILADYKPDGQLLSPTFAPGAIFSGSPYWYTSGTAFPTLTPGASQAFLNTYSTPTSIPLGTSVLFKDTASYIAPISNWLVDYSPADNVNYVNTVIVSSYDPNFKEVSPKGTGAAGTIGYGDSVLEYMVHFQNLGTWPAQNVVVIDTLDDDLEWTSLQPMYQSAQGQITLKQIGSYKIATFTFNNINLPPASTEPVASNGMFTYTIKTKPGLALGTTFKNSASIYFDYNAPVKTNTTLNTLGTPSGVSNVTPDEYHSFTIYPNPAGMTFHAVINSENAANATMTISDITGKTIISKIVELHAGAQTITTDVNQLTPGMYFVSLNNNGKTETSKLVIMK